MSEKYKSENYINLNNTSFIATVGELKDFIGNNLNLTDKELFNAIQPYLPAGFDTSYIKTMIQKSKRKIKIEKLLKNG